MSDLVNWLKRKNDEIQNYLTEPILVVLSLRAFQPEATPCKDRVRTDQRHIFSSSIVYIMPFGRG